jgi:hypothetical protein
LTADATDHSKGVAGRRLGAEDGSGRAALRSALKKVGGKPKAAADAKPGPARRTGRAAQAALGMIGQPPAGCDEAALADWLRGLPPEQRDKLGRLLAHARPADRPPPAGLARVERQMAEQGISFNVNAQTVIVNIGGDSRKSDGPRRDRAWKPRSDWGRQLGRVKDFINGR